MRGAGIVLSAACALACAAPASVASAATITPTVAADDITDNGNCTLREAVEASNTNAAVDLCTAGSTAAADTIVLNFGLYLLTLPGAGEIGNQTGDLDVVPTTGSPLTIVSNLAESEIDGTSGANTDRVIEKSSGGSATTLTLTRVRLDDGTPQAGESGGALRAVGATRVVLNDSRVTNSDTDSRGGGMLVVDDLTLNDSTVSGNASTETSGEVGAGIRTNGDVTISRSSIINNNANAPDDADVDEVFGGGIAATIGSLTIVDSTIGGNTVNPADASDTAAGAGIFADDIPVTIRRSTITTNLVTGVPFARLGGGVFYRDLAPLDGTLEVENSTFEGNLGGGGGFEQGGALRIIGGVTEISSSTFMLNNANTGRSIQYDDFVAGDDPGSSVSVRGSIFDESNPACTAADPITNSGFNIEKGTSCGFGSANGSISGTDPNVQDLDDNGGPTLTGDLLSSSPAVDKIPPASCANVDGAPVDTDQRGAPRGFDEDGDAIAECDMGAYELNRCRDEIVDVVGTPGADDITGTAGSDSILGLAGADEIDGGADDDAICAGEGDDVIAEGFGGVADDFDGGPGTDELRFPDPGSLTGGKIDLTTGVATTAAGPGELNLLFSIEDARGALGPDILIGDGGPNTLSGVGGLDTITGNAGVDTLLGGLSNDSIFARDGGFDAVDCDGGTGDSAQLDRIVVDTSVIGCETQDFLPEPVIVPPPNQGGGGGGVQNQAAPKKCKKGQKLKKGRCVKKKRKKKR